MQGRLSLYRCPGAGITLPVPGAGIILPVPGAGTNLSVPGAGTNLPVPRGYHMPEDRRAPYVA